MRPFTLVCSLLSVLGSVGPVWSQYPYPQYYNNGNSQYPGYYAPPVYYPNNYNPYRSVPQYPVNYAPWGMPQNSNYVPPAPSQRLPSGPEATYEQQPFVPPPTKIPGPPGFPSGPDVTYEQQPFIPPPPTRMPGSPDTLPTYYPSVVVSQGNGQIAAAPASDKTSIAQFMAESVKPYLKEKLKPIEERTWLEADYLMWWMKRAPLAPLVTTGDPTDPVPGALGQPGTRVLLGGSGIDYGIFSGGRITAGGWLDSDHIVAVEGSGFLFQPGSTHFAAASASTGAPPIYLPVINQNPGSANFGNQGSYTVADPLFPSPLDPSIGHVTVTRASRFWGAELSGLVNLYRTPCWRLDGILGFQHLDLQENLRMSGFSTDLFDDLQQNFNDSFSTRNQLYGAQLGARFGYHGERFSLDVTGKVAFGPTHEVVDIQGTSFYAGSGFALPAGVYPGGVLTQPSNIGRTTTDTFTTAPQLNIKLAIELTPRWRATLGYDFLYWSSVVRPGDQVDHNLNPTQFPGATFAGSLLPAPQYNRTDFWAQGVNIGLEFRY